MSAPQTRPSQIGSRDEPIKILDDDLSQPEAPRLLPSTLTVEKEPDEFHENAALLVLPPITFTRRPLPSLDTAEREPKLYWSHELYWSIPACKPVTVTYCRTLEESEAAARRLWQRERLLGFDMEWKPQFHKKPAEQAPGPLTVRDIKENASLIQLACESEIVIFHIAAHAGYSRHQLVAPSLRKLLESPAVTKTGVAIMNADAVRLRKYLGINPRGLFELSHLYKVIEYGDVRGEDPEASEADLAHSRGFKKLVALKKQVEEHLGLPLSKGQVRTSNWSRPVDLTPAQIKYAADDAYAGYMLFRVMNEKRKLMVPRPPIPAHAEQKIPTKTVAEVQKMAATEKENEPPHGDRATDYVSKTSIETEHDADETVFETSEDTNAFKRPRIHQADVQPVLLASIPVPAPRQVIVQQQQHHSISDKTSTKSSPQESAQPSINSHAVSANSETALSDKRAYDSTDRTMRQVFSALRSLNIQLANKLGKKTEEIAPEHILKHLAATRPESAKHIDNDTTIQCRELIRCCHLVGKDLFEFIKRYTPSIEDPREEASATRTRIEDCRSEDVTTNLNPPSYEGKGKRPLSSSLRDLTLEPA